MSWKVLSTFFGAAGSSFLIGCSFIDSLDRALPVGAIPGKVIETSMSDSEIEATGASVVYRFRSVPNLVYVRNFGIDSRAVRITRSEHLVSLSQQFDKTNLVGSSPASPNVFFSLSEDKGGTYNEAGFAATEAYLLGENVALSQVRVAVIDSGIVPATERIRRVLLGNINHTGEQNECDWQDHGTAIASIFVGPADESNSPRGPCVPESMRNRDAPMPSEEVARALAPNAELVGVKISFDSDPGSSLSKDFGSLQLAVAMDEAVASGARLVNLSFSYARAEPLPEVRETERYVIANAASRGVVFVAAAGNAGKNIDYAKVYPPKYSLQNLLVVGAHNSSLQRSTDSNYGEVVDVTAQGVSIPANAPDGSVRLFSGTSFAAPAVVSALAWYLGVDPQADSTLMVRDLFSTSVSAYQTDAKEVTRVSRYGRLNVLGLVKMGYQRRLDRENPRSRD